MNGRRRAAGLLAAGLVAALAMASPAAALCRLALSIGMDISGSVDDTEYRLQVDGLAGALTAEKVQQAFLAVPGSTVRLEVFEWGGVGTQRELVPWTTINGLADLERVARMLNDTPRRPRDVPTALGLAMTFGAEALRSQTDCARRTLDLTGDGQSNQGPNPRLVRDGPALAGITVNALVIGADAPPYSDRRHSEIAELTAYFLSEVIRGPDAFVEAAIGFEQFREAMERKLLRELQTLVIGALEPAPAPQRPAPAPAPQ